MNCLFGLTIFSIVIMWKSLYIAVQILRGEEDDLQSRDTKQVKLMEVIGEYWSNHHMLLIFIRMLHMLSDCSIFI